MKKSHELFVSSKRGVKIINLVRNIFIFAVFQDLIRIISLISAYKSRALSKNINSSFFALDKICLLLYKILFREAIS
ncbi:unnamed protein product [Blepharisma stoltei]|uniref:Uncharacterized protein n=1 Tax=Blepharisma stoltei TaxID=1481888 RepID=A0AAU9IWX3_9CILI|nr:unnamed protein product [Blepharisma stoltei]